MDNIFIDKLCRSNIIVSFIVQLLGQSRAIFCQHFGYFCFIFASASLKSFKFLQHFFRAIRPCDILLSCQTHRLADSGTPLQFYSGNQDTAVHLWSCLSKSRFCSLEKTSPALELTLCITSLFQTNILESRQAIWI